MTVAGQEQAAAPAEAADMGQTDVVEEIMADMEAEQAKAVEEAPGLDDDDDGGEEEAEKAGPEEDEETEEGEEEDSDEEEEEDGEEEEEEDDEEEKEEVKETAGQRKRRLRREKLEAARQEAAEARESLKRSEANVTEMQDLVRRSHESVMASDAERVVIEEERDFWRKAAVESGRVDDGTKAWAESYFAQRLELIRLQNREKATKEAKTAKKEAQVSADAQRMISGLKASAAKFGVDVKRLAHFYAAVAPNGEKTFDQAAQEMAGKRPATKREKRKKNKNKNSKRAPVALDAKGGKGAVFGDDTDGMLAWFEANANAGG